MTASSTLRVPRAEIYRWSRDAVSTATLLSLVALTGVLTYFAVNVAAGDVSSGGGGVEIQTDTVLDGSATNAQLAAMVRSSLSMLVPIGAIVLGAHVAGGEMASGALLQIAVAARRLRYLFVVRGAIVVVLLALAGAGSALAAIVAADRGIANADALAHLSAWDEAGALIGGAIVQAVIMGLVAYGLATLTRRWVVVLVGMLVYLIALEPILSGFIGERQQWLPGAATAAMMTQEPDLAHLIPTAVGALLLVIIALLSVRRDRAAR